MSDPTVGCLAFARPGAGPMADYVRPRLLG